MLLALDAHSLYSEATGKASVISLVLQQGCSVLKDSQQAEQSCSDGEIQSQKGRGVCHVTREEGKRDVIGLEIEPKCG